MNLAFLGMKFHEPIFLPLLKSVRVLLRVMSIRLSTVLYSIQSSANNLAVDSGDMYSGRSLINRRKSRGSTTLSWDTPDWTGADVEVTRQVELAVTRGRK